MKDELLDRILAGEEELKPSSGFAESVMAQVMEESAAPPPIPFPWKRMLPGFVLALAVFGWGGWSLASALGRVSLRGLAGQLPERLSSVAMGSSLATAALTLSATAAVAWLVARLVRLGGLV